MIVRKPSSTKDIEAAQHLLTRFFMEEGFSTPAGLISRNLDQMLSLPACGVFIGETDGEIVGVATISMEFGIEFGWWGEMGDLYVLPEWRGKGISSKLIAAIEDYAKLTGACGYQVTVTPYGEEHVGLKGYYKKLGFESDGRLILMKSFKSD
jgi:GNAT superfamily N-acetyltransferase